MRVFGCAQKAFLLVVAAIFQNRAVAYQVAVFSVARCEARARHASRRPHYRRRVTRIGNKKWSVLAAQKPSRMKRLYSVAFTADFEALSHIDERRHIGILRPQRPRNHRAYMR